MELLTNVYDMMKTGSFDFSESNVMKLALGICQGLKAAHDINVIHRDIKPANFFVSASGEYKLGDFNIAKQTSSTRSFAGTDGYIAPEVYRAKTDAFSSYTKQADIYSLGICLYQIMNNGLFPLENDKCSVDDAIDMRMQNHPFDAPVNASPAFASVIMKACAFDTMHR